MRQGHAGLISILGSLHTSEVRRDFGSEVFRHAETIFGCDLPVVEANPKMLAALAALKA
jgi:hypothetical protein